MAFRNLLFKDIAFEKFHEDFSMVILGEIKSDEILKKKKCKNTDGLSTRTTEDKRKKDREKKKKISEQKKMMQNMMISFHGIFMPLNSIKLNKSMETLKDELNSKKKKKIMLERTLVLEAKRDVCSRLENGKCLID